jgi:hypothetical protein
MQYIVLRKLNRIVNIYLFFIFYFYFGFDCVQFDLFLREKVRHLLPANSVWKTLQPLVLLFTSVVCLYVCMYVCNFMPFAISRY